MFKDPGEEEKPPRACKGDWQRMRSRRKSGRRELCRESPWETAERQKGGEVEEGPVSLVMRWSLFIWERTVLLQAESSWPPVQLKMGDKEMDKAKSLWPLKKLAGDGKVCSNVYTEHTTKGRISFQKKRKLSPGCGKELKERGIENTEKK